MPSFTPAACAVQSRPVGVKDMEATIICIECRERTTLEQIRAGYHSHADFVEDEPPFDPAVNQDE
jgi:hypothetical protein